MSKDKSIVNCPHGKGFHCPECYPRKNGLDLSAHLIPLPPIPPATRHIRDDADPAYAKHNLPKPKVTPPMPPVKAPREEVPEMETCEFCGFDFPEGACCDTPPAVYCTQALEKNAALQPVADPSQEAPAMYQAYCGERLSRGLAASHWSCLSAAQQEVWITMAEPRGYVRIRKLWQRNSGWAQYSWLYYVDLVRHDGVTARSVGVTCHAGEMSEYGKTEGRAKAMAKEIADFFGWPIREFEEERTTTTVLKEK